MKKDRPRIRASNIRRAVDIPTVNMVVTSVLRSNLSSMKRNATPVKMDKGPPPLYV